jgi:hypothetical protein
MRRALGATTFAGTGVKLSRRFLRIEHIYQVLLTFSLTHCQLR